MNEDNILKQNTQLATDIQSSKSKLIFIPHVEQRERWDCGLASVEMILSALSERGGDLNLKEEIFKVGGTKSVWTIDLCYILKHFNIQFSFCTQTFGATPEFSSEEFYRDAFTEDERRVNLLFTKAENNGIAIQKRSLLLSEIREHILLGNPIILLVDANILSCSQCGNKKSSNRRNYLGHFIVICGYIHDTKHFVYHDPSKVSQNCFVDEQILDLSRKSFGTDEDCILVYK